MIGLTRGHFRFGVLALAVAGLLGGCAGKDGTNGTNGQNGATGPTGPPGTAQCMQCHTDSASVADFLLPTETEYALSAHATGETFVERSAPCSGCHTTEGYQARINTGSIPSLQASSHVGCFACHAPHTNMNFNQRKTGATTLADGTVYDKGNSNTCAMCHQARTANPSVASDSTIRSNRWGPHHAVQANYLVGDAAWVFSGQSAYPKDHMHNTNIANGCINCHMGPLPSAAMAGGHTFEVAYETDTGEQQINSKTCVGCHTGWTDALAETQVDADSVAYGASMDSLRDMLVTEHWLDPTTYLPNASSSAPLTGLTHDQKGAIYNYLFLDPDRPSGGNHNPAYEHAVLRATIDFMKNHQ